MGRLGARLERLEKLAEAHAQREEERDPWRHLTGRQSRAMVVLWRDGWWPTWREDGRAPGDPEGFRAACEAALVEADTLTYENTPNDPVAMAENHRRYERWQAIFQPYMAWLHEYVAALERQS